MTTVEADCPVPTISPSFATTDSLQQVAPFILLLSLIAWTWTSSEGKALCRKWCKLLIIYFPLKVIAISVVDLRKLWKNKSSKKKLDNEYAHIGLETSRAWLGSPRLGHPASRAWLGSVISRAVERGSARFVIGSRAGSRATASYCIFASQFTDSQITYKSATTSRF